MKQGTKEWHEARALGVSSSDVAILVGASSWSTPLQLWRQKKGLSEDRGPDADSLQSKQMEFGSFAEPFVLSLFCDQYRIKANLLNLLVRHPKHPWRLATPDALYQEPGGNLHLIELKTCNWKQAGQWRDGNTPAKYLYQVTWAMHVTDADVGQLACMVGGDVKLEVRTIQRNEAFYQRLAEMVAAAEDFHLRLLENIEPDATPPDIKRLAFTEEEEIKEVAHDSDIGKVVLDWANCQDSKEKKKLQALAMQAISPHSAIRLDIGEDRAAVVRVKTVTVGEKLVPEYSYRKLTYWEGEK